MKMKACKDNYIEGIKKPMKVFTEIDDPASLYYALLCPASSVLLSTVISTSS